MAPCGHGLELAHSEEAVPSVESVMASAGQGCVVGVSAVAVCWKYFVAAVVSASVAAAPS